MSPALPDADADRLIHEPARRQIMTVLYAMDSADFLYLLGETGLTKGNLSSHLSKLETAGYVMIEKTFRGKVPLTICRLTAEGRQAFRAYREYLKKGTGEHDVGAMNTFAITTSHLTRRFGDALALDDLTLDIPRGIVFGFLGPNGSGKTTTIRLLLGLIRPTAGEAVVLGHDVRTAAREVRSRTGVLLEHTGLYERLSAEANLDYYARIGQLSEADRRVRVREMLTQIGLWDRRAQPIRDWSRGMKQRLAVARALIHRPELVFLDEPTAGLDPLAAAGLRDDLVELARRDGTTVFLTTHNLTEAERVCQQVGVIRSGQLLAAGRTDELLLRARSQPMVSFVGRGFDERIAAMLRARPEVQGVRRLDSTLHVELRAGADASPLVAAIVSAGAEVEEVRKAKATLEDLFLDLVDDTTAVAPHDARETTTC